jgi:hypothetical protein
MVLHDKLKDPITSTVQRRLRLATLTAALIVASCLYLSARTNDAVSYPTGYREWVHVKTTLVGSKHPAFEKEGGFHHVYANDKAMEGYRTGKFPDGSVIVDDGLELRENSGAMTEGPRRRIAVMAKDSRRYAATGGWGWEVFKGDSSTERLATPEVVAKCVDCHGQKKESDYVFSTYRK